MKYSISVNVTITEADKGNSPASYLNYHRSFTISGNSFTEIAPKVDAVVDAISLVADDEPITGGCLYRPTLNCIHVQDRPVIDEECTSRNRCLRYLQEFKPL